MSRDNLPSTSNESEVRGALQCDFNTCQNCSVNSLDLYTLLLSETLLDFYYKHGVIPCHYRCPKCGDILSPRSAGTRTIFRCQKRYSRKSTRTCQIFVSVTKNTFFDNISVPIPIVTRLVFHYLIRSPPRVNFMKHELGLTSRTIIDYFSFIREVFIYWAVKNSEVIGGEGKIVEIDEAKIGKRKYNRGRYLEGQWVFGGIERGTKRVFLQAVENRTSETLMNIIEQQILPGTTVYSDCWRAYDSLNINNYRHLTVNHSINFVDPETGVHTQNIERLWVEVRKKVPRFGRRKEHYPGYLCEALFMMRYPDHTERFHVFWKNAAALYPPLSH